MKKILIETFIILSVIIVLTASAVIPSLHSYSVKQINSNKGNVLDVKMLAGGGRIKEVVS